MCCKKWVGGLAALALLVVGLGVISGTDAGRYVLGHAWVQVQKVCGWAENQVSLEDEIKRLENEANGIGGDLAKEYDRVASQRREVKGIEKEVGDLRGKLDKQWEAIDQLQSLLEKAKSNGDTFVAIEGKKYDIPTMRADIADRWADFKRGKEGLSRKEAQLEASQNILAKMNENMKKLATVQEDLKMKLKELDTQLKTARLAETNNRAVAVNDELNNRLNHIQESIAKVQGKVEDVMEQAKADGNRTVLKGKTAIDEKIKADTAEEEIAKFRQTKFANDK